MKKEMLINVLQPEECRIAIVEDGVLEELNVERTSQETYVGNIYKGRVVNIEPSIQAVFVDFGIGRNGFLHVSDVDPAYYKHLMSREALAEYEAELEQEYSAPGDPAAGRGQRSTPERSPSRRQPPTPPRTETRRPIVNDPDADDEGFTSGLDEPTIPTYSTRSSSPPPRAEARRPIVNDPDADDEGFTSGLDEPANPSQANRPAAQPPAPRRQPVQPPAPPADDDEFAAGVVDTRAEPDFDEAVHHFPVSEAPTIHLPEQVDEEVEEFSVTLYEPDEDDFGAGIVEETVAVAAPQPKHSPAEPSPEEAEVAPVPVSEEPEPVEADTVEVDTKTRRPARRRTKAKAEETPAPAEEPAAEEPAEAKPKARVRKSRRKPEDGDDKSKLMESAERRTSPTDDDEPEIRPFFEGGLADEFDISAPNDRFDGPPSDQPDVEPTRPAAYSELEEPDLPEPVRPHEGRGFNDDFEDARPPARSDRRGNDRGSSRGRPASRGDRDRDRGPGRSDRDRDRGPGRPAFKAGPPRGGPRTGGARDRGFPKPPIQEIFKRGQEVIVQVIKEGIGTKGPTLSTYISIAGRYLVLMPSLGRVGVSRKIEDHEARRRLRDIMNILSPPKGVGFIVRTAAVDRDQKELQNDLAYLLRLWQVVVRRLKRVAAPVEIYRESDMITRTIRDIFTNDIDTIWVDEANAFAHASEFLQIVMPRYASRIRFYGESEPLFHKYGIEEEIHKIHQKRLDLPLGGSIIIEQTEALVAIDVNSGNFRADNNAEETAYQMNLLAAREIARQLRLRDLGGVIVNDFIDMRSEAHRRGVENALRDAMQRDRARTKILRISQFGLIEMTRQRIRPSFKRSLFADCPHCRGTGFVKTNESMSIEIMRMLQLAAHRTPAIQTVEVTVHAEVAHYLLNKKRKEIAGLEEKAKMEVIVVGGSGISPDTLGLKCLDQNGSEVRLLPAPPPPRLSAGRGPRSSDRRFQQPQD